MAAVFQHFALGASEISETSAASVAMASASGALTPDEAAIAAPMIDALSRRFIVPEFSTGHEGLDNLLAAAIGMTDCPNMDSALDWQQCLDRVLGELQPAAILPSRD